MHHPHGLRLAVPDYTTLHLSTLFGLAYLRAILDCSACESLLSWTQTALQNSSTSNRKRVACNFEDNLVPLPHSPTARGLQLVILTHSLPSSNQVRREATSPSQ